MSKPLKIVTIGGGSTYTPEIIEGFINRHKQLPVSEIWLVDIEEGKEKLEVVGNFAKRMVEKSGINCKVHLTLNRREALKDADFVTTQFRVGLMEARIRDERIPLKYGLLGQETNGFGGFAKALRTVPVILDIAKDMQELCPNAWLVNFTNPSSMVTEAVQRFTGIKCIGLCNVPVLVEKTVEEVLGSSDFTLIMSGLNHYVYGRHVYYQGRDVLPEILPKVMKAELERFSMKNVHVEPWDADFLKALGVIPVAYHRYYYMTDDMLKKQLDEYKGNKVRSEVVKAVEAKLLELYKNPDLKDKPKELEERGGAYYSDAACNLIVSLHTNDYRRMVVNVPNKGTIAGLPDDATIETTSVITSSGAIPLQSGPFSPFIQAQLVLMKTFERLTIEAAMTANYQTAMQALLINPLTAKGKITRTIFDEILKENSAYLPRWK